MAAQTRNTQYAVRKSPKGRLTADSQGERYGRGKLKVPGTFFDKLWLIMTGVVIDYLLFTIYYFFRVIRSWAELLRSFGMQTSAGFKYGIFGIRNE